MWLPKAETRIPSENVPRKGEKAFTEGRRAYRAKPRSRSENVTHKVSNAFTGRTCTSERPKSLYRERRKGFLPRKMQAKAKKPFTEGKRVYRTKPRSRSENVARKVSNAFTGRKCTSERPKSESVARKREIALPSEDVARKCENGFI